MISTGMASSSTSITSSVMATISSYYSGIICKSCSVAISPTTSGSSISSDTIGLFMSMKPVLTKPVRPIPNDGTIAGYSTGSTGIGISILVTATLLHYQSMKALKREYVIFWFAMTSPISASPVSSTLSSETVSSVLSLSSDLSVKSSSLKVEILHWYWLSACGWISLLMSNMLPAPSYV